MKKIFVPSRFTLENKTKKEERNIQKKQTTKAKKKETLACVWRRLGDVILSISTKAERCTGDISVSAATSSAPYRLLPPPARALSTRLFKAPQGGLKGPKKRDEGGSSRKARVERRRLARAFALRLEHESVPVPPDDDVCVTGSGRARFRSCQTRVASKVERERER